MHGNVYIYAYIYVHILGYVRQGRHKIVGLKLKEWKELFSVNYDLMDGCTGARDPEGNARRIISASQTFTLSMSLVSMSSFSSIALSTCSTAVVNLLFCTVSLSLHYTHID